MEINFKRIMDVFLVLLFIIGFSGYANAVVITSFYWDDDGFGVGETMGNLSSPFTSNQEPGEDPLTDQALIGAGFAGVGFPAFEPRGSFSPFFVPAGDTIISAMLTLRTGAFDSGPDSLDGPNMIFLDSMLVDPSFINSFSTANTNQIETLFTSLPTTFFPLFADGSVSLNGTRLSEDFNSGTFQVDFLRLDITTQAATPVPEPSVFALLGVRIVGLVLLRRRGVLGLG